MGSGLLHPNPGLVTARLFDGSNPFFFAEDKVQVKYEMLRAHAIAGVSVIRAAEEHGYSRAAFYIVATAFSGRGVAGLLDERRGRRGPVKLRAEILEFLLAAGPGLSGAALSRLVDERFHVSLHRRTIERALRR